MRITQAHGAGGRAMDEFIREVILGELASLRLGSVNLEHLDDGSSIALKEGEVVVTSDSHVVKPLFFPGGDIGKLAACGTINDLAVMGAEPLGMSCNLVIEEGFEVEKLRRILRSLDTNARANSCPVVCGDTKVVERGVVDELIISTTAIGICNKPLSDFNLKPGDKIIVTGTVGDHGIALLSFREGFSSDLKSDVACILGLMRAAIRAGGVHAAKDPTRGGLANALSEWAEKSGLGIAIEEERIPIKEEVKSLAELLGIDPLSVACEGRAIIAVEPEKAQEVLDAIRSLEIGKDAEIIGEVVLEHPGRVVLHTSIGGKRILEKPLADPVPRIC